MEAALEERRLGADKAKRIVEAMRNSVAEVGIAGSTFDRVSREAGVSRGLLHYYFGSKERLLVEVIRRDTEIRIATLGEALEQAKTADELIAALFEMFNRTMGEQRSYVYLVTELFIAGRDKPEVRRELGELYRRARRRFAEILHQKEAEGVVKLRHDAESVVTYLFAAGDGAAIQRISEPRRDFSGSTTTAVDVARYLLCAE